MAKGFGIAAIIVVVISFFIPVVGYVGVGIAMVLAAIAALAGDRVFATVTAIVGAVSVFAFSPLMWAAMASEDGGTCGKSSFFALVIGILALPFIAMMLNASGKVALGKNTGRNSSGH